VSLPRISPLIVLRCSGAHINVNYVLNGRCTGTSGISGGKRVNRPKNVQPTVSLSQSLADDMSVCMGERVRHDLMMLRGSEPSSHIFSSRISWHASLCVFSFNAAHHLLETQHPSACRPLPVQRCNPFTPPRASRNVVLPVLGTHQIFLCTTVGWRHRQACWSDLHLMLRPRASSVNRRHPATFGR